MQKNKGLSAPFEYVTGITDISSSIYLGCCS